MTKAKIVNGESRFTRLRYNGNEFQQDPDDGSSDRVREERVPVVGGGEAGGWR